MDWFKRRILMFAFLASLVAAITTSTLLYLSVTKPKYETDFKKQLKTYVPKNPDKNAFSILLMGYGGAGHSGGR